MSSQASKEETFQRFSVLHRFLHLVVLVGFTMLALTGLSLAFSAHAWGRFIIQVLGGAETAGNIHRFFAVVTYACVLVHGCWFLYFKWVLKGSWTGPQSILPSGRDVKDMIQHIRYLLGLRRTPPAFNRFTYLEKFDYWAFFLGMNTMGLTGLFLWFPESFSRILPGYFVNLARVLHFYEALMAVILKIAIHVAVAHLRPTVFPVDKTIFTGKTTAERIRTEHPGEWHHMTACGEPSTPAVD